MESLTTMLLISILIMFISSPCLIHSQTLLQLPTFGPEDLAIDPKGQGPYTGVSDGRILKYSNGNFTDFATTSPSRTKEICDGNIDPNLQSTCGRPLGVDFDRFTGDLYISDVFYGVLKVGPNGGLATQLAAGIDGQNFSFVDGVAVDEINKNVYFVDSGAIFLTGNFTQIVTSGDTSGRLLKYDPTTGEVTVMLTGLSGPAGLVVSQDFQFIVVTEFIARRIIKYYIRGSKTGTTETLLSNVAGFPDNVKRGAINGFWVAVSILREPPQNVPLTDSIAIKFDKHGNILQQRNVTDTFPNTISVYLETLFKSYATALVTNFVAVFPGLPFISNRGTSSPGAGEVYTS